jgi:hypothetical protein
MPRTDIGEASLRRQDPVATASVKRAIRTRPNRSGTDPKPAFRLT